MTREEAIKEIERAFDVLDHSCHMDNRRKEAFNMARVALFAEPCDDAISRQAVIDTTFCNGISCNECSFITLEDGKPVCLLYERVMKLPPVTPKQRIGHWVKISPAGIYECSECGQNVMTGDIDAYRHCHGCGAKMAESEEQE